jgi:hypothetical protein
VPVPTFRQNVVVVAVSLLSLPLVGCLSDDQRCEYVTAHFDYEYVPSTAGFGSTEAANLAAAINSSDSITAFLRQYEEGPMEHQALIAVLSPYPTDPFGPPDGELVVNWTEGWATQRSSLEITVNTQVANDGARGGAAQALEVWVQERAEIIRASMETTFRNATIGQTAVNHWGYWCCLNC